MSEMPWASHLRDHPGSRRCALLAGDDHPDM